LGQIQIQIAYIRVWGALFRAAGWEGEGRRSEGLTWRTLLAGEGSDEDLATGGAARPAVVARKEGHEPTGEVGGEVGSAEREARR